MMSGNPLKDALMKKRGTILQISIVPAEGEENMGMEMMENGEEKMGEAKAQLGSDLAPPKAKSMEMSKMQAMGDQEQESEDDDYSKLSMKDAMTKAFKKKGM